ncbi:endonuclease/exonuclease/phosphatase family protein [Penicillium maclennaniae]|uniref:endonuclease/exonuclease/phosphatase family protein n=1 Tax=Penicillium maclennaniae TaxID=1343394 RepID=UPI0025414977|nr:endonuclease/exonuclease/phosphatase family protein [Penicillium maclennaniae]KAJ5677239.1 endonuclease/exonuclease/phosphatase family protein [Penicillium maclennaniae]
MMLKAVSLFLCVSALLASTSALTISEINGNRYLSAYADQTVTNIQGLVTAKSTAGFYLRSTAPDHDDATSESIYVYGSAGARNVSVGDIITLSGKVAEYRSSPSYVYQTELTSASAITVISSGNEVVPLVLGKGGKGSRTPPTKQFSALDGGDVLSVPNNVSLISRENPKLNPGKFGMDFWESLSGELVRMENVRAIAKPNTYGDTWVLGDWKVSGENERGGLTMTNKDSNPEAVLVGSPLDGSKNPKDTKLGDAIGDITGIITAAYGALTFGVYNVNNLAPSSKTLPKIAQHIVQYLKSPTLVFLQEIQDDDGPTNDGVVSANKTLSTLVQAITNQGGANYSFIDIDPINKQDGGQPGGNIRVSYLYDPSVIRLRNANPGSNTDANEVLAGPELKYNPGLIDPSNDAWHDSRKPLAAAWETLDGKNKFFTVNVHFMSKGGGSSIEGDARPPVNGGVATREAQAKLVADFTSSILAQDHKAKIIASGDFNEFTFAQPLETFLHESGLKDLEEVANIKPTERYTYLFDMNCQQLDHMFVSSELAKKAKMQHLHINTWVSYDDQASDHDPTVALLNVCIVYGRDVCPDAPGDLVVQDEYLGWMPEKRPDELIDDYGVTFDRLVPAVDTNPEVLQISIIEIEDDHGVYANTWLLFAVDAGLSSGFRGEQFSSAGLAHGASAPAQKGFVQIMIIATYSDELDALANIPADFA